MEAGREQIYPAQPSNESLPAWLEEGKAWDCLQTESDFPKLCNPSWPLEKRREKLRARWLASFQAPWFKPWLLTFGDSGPRLY